MDPFFGISKPIYPIPPVKTITRTHETVAPEYNSLSVALQDHGVDLDNIDKNSLSKIHIKTVFDTFDDRAETRLVTYEEVANPNYSSQFKI